MQLNYKANPTFAKVHRDASRFVFIRGPVGSGKSSGCIMQLFFSALTQVPDSDGVRRSRFAVIRSTYPALKSTVVKSWKIWFKDLIKVVYDVPIRGTVKLNHPDAQTKIEMEIVFIALDRPEEVNKLQSLELTAAHINEAAEIDQSIHQMLKSRVNRFPPKGDGGASWPFIVCDYNSTDTEHWLYELAEEIVPDKHSFYSQPPALLVCGEEEALCTDAEGNHYKINPDADNIENLDEDYYVDQVAGADADWVNVMILNNYGSVRAGRPVYKAYEDKVHCADVSLRPLEGVPILIGVDCGLTPAAAFCQLTPTGQLLCFDEIVTENTSIQEFAYDILWPHVRNVYPKFDFEVVVDPAARQRSQNDKRSAMDVLVGAGLPVRLAKTNEPLARREAVNFFLRKSFGSSPGFLLSPSCRYLRKGFISEYKFSEVLSSKTTRFKDKPEKNIYSHVHDGLQYASVEFHSGRAHRRRVSRGTVPSAHRYPADTVAGY